jgi:predicted porin
MTPFGDTGYGSAKKLAVAASYTVGPAKLIGGYRWEKATYSNDATFIRDDMWWAGVNYQATQALGLTLAYYYDKLKTLQLSKAGAPSSPANPWQVSFIADYNFSKRTDVYLTTAYARNAGLNFDTSAIGFANGYFPGAGQTSMVGAAVGIRHKF